MNCSVVSPRNDESVWNMGQWNTFQNQLQSSSSERKNRIILHIDFDSFFASCEQQFNPKLQNRPIGVTAANSRTCIIASSREAKRFGIKTGSTSWNAYRKCPSIILVPANFVRYWEISKKFISICKDFSPYVEVFSIDELFMDITKSAHLFGGTDQLIAKLKGRIKNEIGVYITVSVGVSQNKLLAKLGSGLHKPNGVTKITPENLDQIYKTAQLTDVCGIGFRIERRLNAMGIYSLLKLRQTPLRCLIAEFGNVEGNILFNIGLGLDNSEVLSFTDEPEVKSVGRNYCLARNEYNERIVHQNFYELCEELAIKLRKLGKVARTAGFSWHGSFTLHYRKTYKESFNTGYEIYRNCIQLLPYNPFIDEMSYVRQIRVWVSSFSDKQTTQRSLFYKPRTQKLWRTVDKINDRFGNHTIRSGFLLYSAKLTTVPNGYMADKYERIKLARENQNLL